VPGSYAMLAELQGTETRRDVRKVRMYITTEIEKRGGDNGLEL